MDEGISLGLVMALVEEATGADPAVIEQAVQDWLDDHPEATTTVADGSITEQKLAAAVAAKINQVSQLSDEIAIVKSAYNNDKVAFDLIPDQYIKNNNSPGDIVNYNGWSRTDKISIDGGGFYTIISTKNSTYNAYYDNSDNFISLFAVVNGTTGIVAPENAEYMMLSNDTSSMGTLTIYKHESYNTLSKLNIPFEIGNISFIDADTQPRFGVSLTRVRTPEHFTIHFSGGDIVGLSSYADAQYWLIWKNSNNEYKHLDRINKDTVISEEGDYWILISNKTEVSQDGNPGILGSMFTLHAVNRANNVYDFILDRFNDNAEKVNAILDQTAIGLNHFLMKPSAPKMIMHRGYSSNAPENSIPAFTLAGKNGAWGIETDIWETTDGHFVCFHDETVDRMTNGTGNIKDMTLAQVKELVIDAGANIGEYTDLKIPTLEEYLSICRRYGCIAIIEIKTIENYADVLTIIKSKGMLNNCVFLTGSESTIINLRAETECPIGYIGYTPSVFSDMLSTVKNYSNVWLDLAVSTVVNDTDIIAAHLQNIPVLAWATDDAETVNTLFNYGVDAITTNSIPKAE